MRHNAENHDLSLGDALSPAALESVAGGGSVIDGIIRVVKTVVFGDSDDGGGDCLRPPRKDT